MHASGARVGCGVGFAIGLRNGMILVGGEVIPEIVEVGALASFNQGFGRWTVEAKMPYPRVVVNVLPTSYARQESIHQHQLRDFGREVGRMGVSNYYSDFGPHNFAFLTACI